MGRYSSLHPLVYSFYSLGVAIIPGINWLICHGILGLASTVFLVVSQADWLSFLLGWFLMFLVILLFLGFQQVRLGSRWVFLGFLLKPLTWYVYLHFVAKWNKLNIFFTLGIMTLILSLFLYMALSVLTKER